MKKYIMYVLICLMMVSTLSGCKVVNTVKGAKEKSNSSKELEEYEINENNYLEFTVNEKIFVIGNEEISSKEINEAVGKVNKVVKYSDIEKTADEGELEVIYEISNKEDNLKNKVSYGWVYSINKKDENEELAIIVNSKFWKATLKE